MTEKQLTVLFAVFFMLTGAIVQGTASVEFTTADHRYWVFGVLGGVQFVAGCALLGRTRR